MIRDLHKAFAAEWRGRFIIWVQSSSSMVVNVKTWSVRHGLPALGRELYGGTNFTEFSGNVQHWHHGQKESKTSLNCNVQGDWQAFTCPCERPPFRYRVGCMEQGGNGHKENASHTFLLWRRIGCSSAKHLNEQGPTLFTMLYYYSSYYRIEKEKTMHSWRMQLHLEMMIVLAKDHLQHHSPRALVSDSSRVLEY